MLKGAVIDAAGIAQRSDCDSNLARAGKASPVALVTTWEARCGELWCIHGGGLDTSRAKRCDGSWMWPLPDDSLRPHTVSLPLRGPSLCSVHMLLCGTYHTLYACQKMTACKAYHRSLMLFLGPRSRQDTANVVGWSEVRSPAVEDRSLRSVDVPLQQIHDHRTTVRGEGSEG